MTQTNSVANEGLSRGTQMPVLAAVPPSLDQLAVRRALQFMHLNIGDHFTLEQLAVHAGASRFHFARLFRARLGYSPMEYLMRLRAERGKSLLESSEASVCEIAAHLGFCDQSHFTRTFRRVFGMSPRDYLASTRGSSPAPQRSDRSTEAVIENSSSKEEASWTSC